MGLCGESIARAGNAGLAFHNFATLKLQLFAVDRWRECLYPPVGLDSECVQVHLPEQDYYGQAAA